MTEHGARPDGTVLSTAGGVYQVQIEGGAVVDAVLRGRLKLEQRIGDRVVPGDRVRIERQADSHVIEGVSPRRSQLARRAPGRGASRAKVIVANVDQVVAVFAVREPEPNPRLLDRFLVLAEANDLPAFIIANKIDLIEGDDGTLEFAAYENAGYTVLRTSVKTGLGVEAVKDRLCGRWSVLAGPSGAGKSSLLNAVQPGLGLRVAEIGVAMKGRHTTVSGRLVPLDCGGYVADTPGLRELGLWGIEPHELRALFPEFRDWAEDCAFTRSCAHATEPGCAVREAVERGDIDRARYDSYLALRAGSSR